MLRHDRSSPSKWGSVSSGVVDATGADVLRSALKNTDQAVRKTEPFGHDPDDIGEEGLAQRRLLAFDSLERGRVELIKNARRLGLD